MANSQDTNERLAQPEQPDELTIWKSRALQAERVIEKFMKPVQEPVATVVKRQYEDGTYAGNALDWAGRNCEDDFPVGTKLYTDPQPVKFNCTVVDADHPNGVPLSQWGKQHEMQPCAGRNCGSTNPNLHSAECFEDYEKSTGMNQWQETDAPHWSSYKQGWEDGVMAERQRIVNLLMIQHGMANGAHNYWHVAAQLIQADVASDT